MSDPGTADPNPLRDTTVQVIVASTLMGVMGVSLISPALPEVRRGLAITEAEASLILSAFTLPGILLGPVIGMWADRWGRKTVLVPCLFLYGLAGGAVVFAPGLWTVVGLRVLQGSAAAGLITLAITLIGDTFEGSQRNAIMGFNGAMLAIGTGAYPLIGGGLSLVDWRAPFAVYLIGVPAGLFALRVLDEPDREHGETGLAYLKGALKALPLGRAVALYGTALGIFIVLYGAVLTILPFLLDQDLGLSAFQIGILLSVSSIATGVASSQNGRLARRFDNEPIIGTGVFLLGVGVAGIALASSPVHFGLAILPFGAGMGFAMPSLDTAISELTPGAYRGGAMSLRTSMVRLGQTVGPTLFTASAAVWTSRSLLLTTGLIVLATSTIGLFAWRALPHSGAQEASSH